MVLRSKGSTSHSNKDPRTASLLGDGPDTLLQVPDTPMLLQGSWGNVELLQAERKGRSHHATLPSCLTAWALPEAHRGVATLSGVSDMSTPTHPGWTSGGGIHRVPSWGSHAAANPRPAFSEFLDFLIFAPSFNFFPEFRISAWCSLCFFACSLANLQAVVWGPCKASPNYITAWLFQIKESCWHTKI